MGKVVFDISMSMDGFITGANPHPDAEWGGLGEGGERLHDWGFNSADPRNREIMEWYATIGANIFGRTGYDHSIINWEQTVQLDLPGYRQSSSHTVSRKIYPREACTRLSIALKPPLRQQKNCQAIRMFI
jgi:hypothetical protein